MAESNNNLPALPDYMKKFIQTTNQDTTAAASASMSVPRLTIRGKRWRFVEDGEEELVKDLHVDVVILGVEPGIGKFAKTFYEKTYTSGDKDVPTCSSTNGVKPDSWVSTPQAPLCANCSKNVFGSATSMSGKKAKACRDSKILWVAKPNDPKKFYGLKTPVMSLKSLSEYGKYVAKNNYPLALVITRLGFDDNSEYAKLTFEHVGFVSENKVEDAISVNTERPWNSVAEDFAQIDTDEKLALPGPQNLGPQGPAHGPQLTAPKESIDKVLGNW